MVDFGKILGIPTNGFLCVRQQHLQVVFDNRVTVTFIQVDKTSSFLPYEVV